MSVCYQPGSEDWRPHRGDYGTEYSFDLVAIIEEMNCSAGCVFAISANSGGLGPGGACSVLNAVAAGDGTPIPELDPRPSGPFCRKQQIPAERVPDGQGELLPAPARHRDLEPGELADARPEPPDPDER